MSNTISIREVAKAAGVSKSTVSRVLSGRGKECRIAMATQLRVRAAATQLGYQPNLIAHDMALGKGVSLTGSARTEESIQASEVSSQNQGVAAEPAPVAIAPEVETPVAAEVGSDTSPSSPVVVPTPPDLPIEETTPPPEPKTEERIQESEVSSQNQSVSPEPAPVATAQEVETPVLAEVGSATAPSSPVVVPTPPDLPREETAPPPEPKTEERIQKSEVGNQNQGVAPDPAPVATTPEVETPVAAEVSGEAAPPSPVVVPAPPDLPIEETTPPPEPETEESIQTPEVSSQNHIVEPEPAPVTAAPEVETPVAAEVGSEAAPPSPVVVPAPPDLPREETPPPPEPKTEERIQKSEVSSQNQDAAPEPAPVVAAPEVEMPVVAEVGSETVPSPPVVVPTPPDLPREETAPPAGPKTEERIQESEVSSLNQDAAPDPAPAATAPEVETPVVAEVDSATAPSSPVVVPAPPDLPIEETTPR